MHGDIQQCTMATPWLNGNGCRGGGGERERERERGGGFCDVQTDQYKVKIKSCCISP